MTAGSAAALSLFQLLDPEVLADPYPLYAELQERAPVHWDPYLHAWVVTRYADVVHVFQHFLAARTPTPQRLADIGLGELAPAAELMMKQMLFLDPPDHGRVRAIAAVAFTPRRVRELRERIQAVVDGLIDKVIASGTMDVINDLANPLPSMVTAQLLGVPIEDHAQLKAWSEDFAEVLGNFQHNPGRSARVLAAVEGMTSYFRNQLQLQALRPTEGLLNALSTAVVDGDRLDEDEVVANIIVTMIGGLETTTNLIGNGLLTLLRHPAALAQLKAQPDLIDSAVEELLRFESPSQHTARLASKDTLLGGQLIKQGQAVVVVMGAANRDPERFAAPAHLDLARRDNRHLAFAWAAHFCFGAPLARLEGQLAIGSMLRRLPHLQAATGNLQWRPNLGLRGLVSLPVTFDIVQDPRLQLTE